MLAKAMGANKLIGVDAVDERLELVTNRFSLEQAGEAYALMASGKCGKVAVVFDEEVKIVELLEVSSDSFKLGRDGFRLRQGFGGTGPRRPIFSL
jgi:hypothetical protein